MNGLQEKSPGRSIAIWTKNVPNKKPTATLHVNFWQLDKKGCDTPSRDFFDLGVLIKLPQGVNELFLYIPAALDENNLEDLAKRFKDSDIVTGIFNEPINCLNTSHGNNIIPLIRQTDSSVYTNVYEFTVTNNRINKDELNIEPRDDGGTVIHITSKVFERVRRSNLESLYFRLRIKLPPKIQTPFAKKFYPKDRVFLSGFERIQYVDFRYNELRNLPQEINRELTDPKNSYLHIQRIDFLLVVAATVELRNGHKPFNKSRLLEKELWSKYIDRELGPSDEMVIFHWKEPKETKEEKEPIRDFNAFIKMHNRIGGKSAMLCFVASAIFIGALGNWLCALFVN